MTATPLRDDGHGRLPWLRRDELDDDQGAVYDGIIGGPRAGAKSLSPLLDDEGRLHGPFNSMLYSPALGSALQSVGAAIRYRSSLSDREREIAILIAAVRERSSFEWLAHVDVARAAGLDEDDIAAIAGGTAAQRFTDSESVVVAITESLIDRADLGDELWARGVDALGVAKVVELVTLVGYYRALSLGLRVYRVGLPEGYGGRWPLDAAPAASRANA